VKEKKKKKNILFIIEINLGKKIYIKEGKDKWILNSITIFNSIPSSYISKIINIGLIFIVFKYFNAKISKYNKTEYS